MGNSGAGYDDEEDDEFFERRFESFPIGDEEGDSTAVYDRGDMDTDEGFPKSKQTPEVGPWRSGARIRGYRIQRLLGQGATGAVYSAVDAASNSQVALKVLLRPEANTINRLKRGFRALAEVFHPNLVMLYGLHQYEDQCFISMEQVDGLPLLKAIASEDIHDAKAFYNRLNAILREAGRALHALHSNQLVHRDIKPNNILIDRTGRLRLIDYGMVGSFDPVWDPDGHRAYVAGNQKYMAPEVLSKQNYPPGSDIFSLGRVIAKVARSCHPYGKSIRLDSEKLLPIDMPKSLKNLIRRMLSVEVKERPTAWEVASAAGGASEATVSTLVNPWQLQIVGRDDSMQHVRRWLSRLVSGQSKRLHITAPPGIGKSRFLSAVAEQLQEHKWLQIFESRCRRREEVPLQAFDEMLDALARRYSSVNAGRLELDPVSSQILRAAFPVLRGVLKKADEVPRDRSLGRVEANDAAVQLTAQICRHGPVIIIIDDLQWADQDSLTLLHKLEQEVSGVLGVITASRDDFQPPHLSATDQLKLRPLTMDESTKMLRTHLMLRRIDLPDAIVERFVRLAAGNCHHLLQLAACVSAFDSQELASWADGGPLNIRQLWQRRFAQLTSDQRIVLTSMVAAGGPVDLGDVLSVTELGDAGRRAVASLLQENWLNERVQTHHIEIFHDTIAEALVEFLPPDQLRNAHAQWAARLIASEKAVPAARIAGQLIESDQKEAATPYAIRAAEEAMQRFAFGEAARWHHRAAELLDGAEAVEHLRLAAEAFTVGGQSAQAAKTYLQLAGHPHEPYQERARGLAADSFLRAGEIHKARDATARLAKQLGLPQPKPQWLSTLWIVTNLIRMRLRGGYRLPQPAAGQEDGHARAEACFRITRALSVYDNIYAAELLTTGLLKLKHFDAIRDCVHSGSAYVAFGSYTPGWWRRDSVRLLGEVMQAAQRDGSPDSLAHALNATGFHHWMLCEFADSLTPLEESGDLYRNQCKGRIFESVHTALATLTSCFFLGRVEQLIQSSQAMIRDARDRDDQFTLHVATTGFAATALLFLGETRSVKQFNRSSAAPGRRENPQMFHALQTIALVFQKLYAGYPQQAAKLLEVHRRSFRRSGFFRLQLGRVSWSWLKANAALQVALSADESNAKRWLQEASQQAHRLAAENLPFATLASNLTFARVAELQGQTESAKTLYREAAGAADQQQLEPFRLAALDGLDALGRNRRVDTRLHDFLLTANVHDPAASEKLYVPSRGQ
ncbi:serine/threonine-protein kinase [Roseimaritima ulvae]|uniref:Serine/threonine-protein kinase PrkC n=1 Tax=Roseimaritima ulvae TaxID=980254 RepID=A0A5B9QKZ0_9BACT|nr:serine/threonine-protein kinase [Roseimaritima ulvae]QEG39758.1 Serine/threonine-protein kinase PrkC [Roseimaritima ulvae]